MVSTTTKIVIIYPTKIGNNKKWNDNFAPPGPKQWLSLHEIFLNDIREASEVAWLVVGN